MKGMIIYKGKYGATRQYAEWLGTALNFPLVFAGHEAKEQLADAGYLLIGTSIYIGKLQIRDWLKKHQSLLANKKLYLFIVTGTALNETEKLEGYYQANVPAEIRNKCKCYFLPGKLEFNKLSWTDKLLLRIGAMLTKRSDDKIPMADYNEVKKENIAALINAVKADMNQHSILQS